MVTVELKSFVKRVGAAKQRIYEITVPCADSRSAFYRLAVYPLKEAMFRKAWKDGLTVNLDEFGEIIESSYLPNTRIIKPTETNN